MPCLLLERGGSAHSIGLLACAIVAGPEGTREGTQDGDPQLAMPPRPWWQTPAWFRSSERHRPCCSCGMRLADDPPEIGSEMLASLWRHEVANRHRSGGDR